MNILVNGKCLLKAYKTFPNTISALVSVCAVVWLRIPYTALVPSSANLKQTRFYSYINGELHRRNILLSKLYKYPDMLHKSVHSEDKETNPRTLLRLEDYDCIGFDLDNTLCEYNISSSVKMEYNALANFLVNQKGYDPCLLKPLDAHSIDFLQKGLIIDFARGNILKIGENGVIFKASHGTKFMTEEEIVYTYGKDKKWEVTSEFCRNLLAAWEGPLSEKMRALLDYFDMPASLAYARIIDSLGNVKLSNNADLSSVWVDVREGLINMYKREHFADGKGDYFREIKSNPQNFIKKCDTAVVEWLKQIKDKHILFLITGSNCDFASLTAETCLGKNWRSLFDVVVCYARKPGFFTGCRPFVRLENFKETNVVDSNDLELENIYSQGNWQELYQLFAQKVNKRQPKCLYFGDNLIQDIYTPSEYTKCDTVAVVEELSAEVKEKHISSYSKIHSSVEILESAIWGSYFFDDNEKLKTIWGRVIKNNAKYCVPSLSVLADNSTLSYKLPTFLKI